MDGSDLERAKSFLESAKQHEKRSWLKKPKWDEAADDYERAAKMFTHIGDIAQATAAWTKAYEAHNNARSFLPAGRAKEALALLLAEQAGRHPESRTGLLMHAVKTYGDASAHYALHGMVDRRVDVLRKAAQLLCPTAPVTCPSASALEESQKQQQEITPQAISFLRESVEVFEEYADENPVFLTRLPDIYRIWVLVHLRSGDVRGAVEVLKRQLGVGAKEGVKGVFELLSQPDKAAKAALEIVILCLVCGDDVWARQELERLQKTVSGFARSNEMVVAQSLLAAFEERDPEQLREALRDQTLQFINADISRMARKITIRFNTTDGETAMAAPPQPLQQEGQSFEIPPEEDIR